MQKIRKMKSYGLAAIQCDWCPSKRRGYTGKGIHRGKTLGEHREKTKSTSQGVLRLREKPVCLP